MGPISSQLTEDLVKAAIKQGTTTETSTTLEWIGTLGATSAAATLVALNERAAAHGEAAAACSKASLMSALARHTVLVPGSYV